MQLNHEVLPAKFCIIFVWAESFSCANWVTDIKRGGGCCWTVPDQMADFKLICNLFTECVQDSNNDCPWMEPFTLQTHSYISIINTVLYSFPSVFFSFYSSTAHWKQRQFLLAEGPKEEEKDNMGGGNKSVTETSFIISPTFKSCMLLLHLFSLHTCKVTPHRNNI